MRTLEYTLPSGLASVSGTTLGEKSFTFPITRRELEKALQEALIELAIMVNEEK